MTPEIAAAIEKAAAALYVAARTVPLEHMPQMTDARAELLMLLAKEAA